MTCTLSASLHIRSKTCYHFHFHTHRY